MNKCLLILLFIFLSTGVSIAQLTLPAISVTNYNGKILINWKNTYTLPAATISIQRSYDSLKNYSTIGSVLNPQNEENGYSDNEPPYNKMYYRVFIAFEGGSYILSRAVRPVKLIDTTSSGVTKRDRNFPWQVDPGKDSAYNPAPPAKNEITYPSLRIFTAKDNNVVIYLPDAEIKKYTAKFYNEFEKKIFELTNLKEEYLILEKVNFVRAGWYYFDLYEDGKLIEKNKFLVPRDGKIINR